MANRYGVAKQADVAGCSCENVQHGQFTSCCSAEPTCIVPVYAWCSGWKPHHSAPVLHWFASRTKHVFCVAAYISYIMPMPFVLTVNICCFFNTTKDTSWVRSFKKLMSQTHSLGCYLTICFWMYVFYIAELPIQVPQNLLHLQLWCVLATIGQIHRRLVVPYCQQPWNMAALVDTSRKTYTTVYTTKLMLTKK